MTRITKGNPSGFSILQFIMDARLKPAHDTEFVGRKAKA